MKSSLSGPQLVSMAGENISFGVDLYMGMNPGDRIILHKGYVTPREERYLYSRYPELMGFLPALIAAIPAIATGAASIIGAVKGSKKSSPQQVQQTNDTMVSALQAKIDDLAEQRERETMLAQQQAQSRQTLMMIGIPAAALIAILLLKK